MVVTACGKSYQAAAPTEPASQAPAAAVAAAPTTDRASMRHGPDVLTTDGEAGDLKEVISTHGVFRIAAIDGVDTLTLNGKPLSYRAAEGGDPEVVAANDGLTLHGVFELEGESVAWATIIGGTACAGTHVLVPAGLTKTVEGVSIPGCDDRGTIRKVGDRLEFKAGGTSGTYAHGRLQ